MKHFLRCKSNPEPIINKYIKKRLKTIKNAYPSTNLTNKRAILLKDKVVIPYIKHLSPKINLILQRHNMVPINKTITKFNNIITLCKDPLEKSDTYGIIYKIDCQLYTSTYIGMSKRKLKKRTYEHIRAIINCAGNSALAGYAEKTGHTIDFNNAKTLHSEVLESHKLQCEYMPWVLK